MTLRISTKEILRGLGYGLRSFMPGARCGSVPTNITAKSLRGSMSEINRSLVILKPKQPYLDWTQTIDDEDEDLTLEQVAEDSTAYLIPELWQDSDQQELLESYYEVLFEEPLERWSADET